MSLSEDEELSLDSALLELTNETLFELPSSSRKTENNIAKEENTPEPTNGRNRNSRRNASTKKRSLGNSPDNGEPAGPLTTLIVTSPDSSPYNSKTNQSMSSPNNSRRSRHHQPRQLGFLSQPELPSHDDDDTQLVPPETERAPHERTPVGKNVHVDKDGLPKIRAKELHVYGPEGRFANFPWQENTLLLDVLHKVCVMWPALNLNVDMPVTDEHGSVINIKGENNVCVTMGEVNAKRILFSTTIDEWKKENTSHVHHHHHHLNLSPLHTTNAHNASTPTTTKLLSLITPRLSMLRIYLPNGQLSTTTIWDGSKCLKSVLEEICSKRKISMEGKIARDLNGGVIHCKRLQ
eukprot:TRINITY_DN4906_c0_g1_i2.p1 TRINITY_DN4906_c0_g1~~TRINITY_DN4906_c0_g1_i2.p1  ORF type:complete len:350 (-),score=64.53 TRINITY_DN4906_c0_g1_i2:42-1091(-)